MNIIQELKDQSILRLEENLPRIEKCFALLTEEEVWHKPTSISNSMANLVLHLCGNIRQYIYASLGGNEDTRTRDLEFETIGGYSKSELLQKLSKTIDDATTAIKNTTESEMMRSRSVQGFELTGIGIVIHVVEHYSYHTGQIAYWTKYLKNKDLGFYGDMDLNVSNG